MPEPLFILCPGRSFSSVVSTVIGQHPQCYGLPELNIFIGRSLGECWDNDATRSTYPLQGLKRTLAQLHDGAQTDETIEKAEAWIAERRDWSGAAVMAHIQEQVGDRILVDKSPANVVHPKVLGQIVRAYPRASYLQLLRHPRTRGKSHMAAHYPKAGIKRVMIDAMGSPAPDVEYKWHSTHKMIDALARELSLGQMMRIRGEDLLRDLRLYLPQICEWLGIRADAKALAAMLRPEDSPYACLGPTRARYGANPGFLANPALDFDRLANIPEASLDGPLDWDAQAEFHPDTRHHAHAYGYR